MEAKNSSSVSNQERSAQTYFRKEIRSEWKDLWNQKFEDKQIAEDVAIRNYELLFVEEGTVIRANRKYKPLDLEDIIERNEKILGLRLTIPRPEEGGYRKFAKEVLSKETRGRKTRVRRDEFPKEKVRNGPPKKAGRGWIHSQ